MPRLKHGRCALCQRDCRLTFHHLVPRKMHRRAHFRKHFLRSELQQGIDICAQCHSGLHRLYDEMTLARQFNSLEKLLADEKINRHVQWVARQRVSED